MHTEKLPEKTVKRQKVQEKGAEEQIQWFRERKRREGVGKFNPRHTRTPTYKSMHSVHFRRIRSLSTYMNIHIYVYAYTYICIRV